MNFPFAIRVAIQYVPEGAMVVLCGDDSQVDYIVRDSYPIFSGDTIIGRDACGKGYRYLTRIGRINGSHLPQERLVIWTPEATDFRAFVKAALKED